MTCINCVNLPDEKLMFNSSIGHYEKVLICKKSRIELDSKLINVASCIYFEQKPQPNELDRYSCEGCDPFGTTLWIKRLKNENN